MNGLLRNWLEPVANKKDYLLALQAVVEQLHQCGAYWIRTEPVREDFKGQTIWEGDVEVFGLVGHPRALQAFGWAEKVKAEDEPRFVAVLEVPPVTNAKTAVEASIVADLKKSQS